MRLRGHAREARIDGRILRITGSTALRMDDEGWRLGGDALARCRRKNGKRRNGGAGGGGGRRPHDAPRRDARRPTVKTMPSASMYISATFQRSTTLSGQISRILTIICLHCVKYLFVALINSYIFLIYLKINGYCNET